MNHKECIPFAPALIESMRSLGYSFSSAMADLIDNSISAHATDIKIYSEPGGDDPSLVILDNGHGMDSGEIYEAMRYGSTNPLDERSGEDLGRFGLGLKSASLSQCRRLVVASRKDGALSAYSWDLDYVISSGSWMLKVYSEEEIMELPMIDQLKSMQSGTCVILSNFDRIKESTDDVQKTFNGCLVDMIEHISLVFHRFIDDGLNIYVNNRIVEAKDPFLLKNSATQRKRESRVYIDGREIKLQPFILPHLSKLSESDLKKAGGRERLKNDQGFYIYRNKRLIIWGTWFRLERKGELSKLARVMVDIPNSLDYMWSIDIKKSTATLPDKIKKNMYNAVYESVAGSEAVHTYRGRKEKKDKDIEYIWERVKVRDGYEYQINRKIPQLELLEATLDKQGLKLLKSLMDTIEKALPVQALYVDMAKGEIEGKNGNEDDITDELWNELQIQMDYVKTNNLPVREYYSMFMKVEPYCRHKNIIEKIEEEIKKYE